MRKKAPILSSLQLVFGFFMALIVLTQSVHVPSGEVDAQEQESSDEEKGQGKIEIVQSKALPGNSLQISLEFPSYLLEEVRYQTDKAGGDYSSEHVIERIQKAIKILFRKIISPNAP